MRSLRVAGLAAVVMAGLSGCGLGKPGNTGTATTAASGAMNGHVFGGQQPVTGSTVQLWQVGTTGYGVGASALGPSVTTDSSGSFSITGNYNCSNAVSGVNTLVYITATGGNSGSGNNAQLAMMTALGPCVSLTSSTFININEVTTVAAVWALSPFMTAANGVGSFGYSTQGLLDAFTMASQLANTSTGSAPTFTPNALGVIPQAKINSLANILASCINTASVGSAASATCASLFTAATPSGGTAPTNTLAAALDIAQNPSNNVAALFALSTGTPPFAPNLSSAPNDWTLAVPYTVSNSNVVNALAVDASDNVWVAIYAANAGSVKQVTQAGFVSGAHTAGVAGAFGMAFDSTGALWLADHDSNQISALSGSTGNSIAGPFQYGDTSGPAAIALDVNNNFWVANKSGNSMTQANAGQPGQSISPSSGWTGGGLSNPNGVAVDSNDNVWVTNSGGSVVSELAASTGAPVSASGYTGGGINAPAGVAIDNGNNAWVANSGNNSISKISGGVVVSPTNGYTGGGVSAPKGIAVDGNGYVWTANSGNNSISVFKSTGTAVSGTNGYKDNSLVSPSALAIDRTGSVWVANLSGMVTKFIGVATPVITPQQVAISSGQQGQRPGTPIPLSILTSYLSPYTVGTAYNAQMQATGGNTGTYKWTLNSGSLPASMTLSTGGLISGTSSASGTSTFTLKVCDAGNAANCTVSGSLTLTSSNSLPTGGSESLLNGNYVIRFGGFNNGFGLSNGFVDGFVIVARLTFDGTGNITAGEWDFNNPSSHSTSAIAVTGKYSVGADHRGQMIVNIGGGSTNIAFALSVGNLNGSSIAQDVKIIEFDDTNTPNAPTADTGAGIGKLQTATTASLNQTWVFGFDGETPCVTYNSNGCSNGNFFPFGTISAAGIFTGNNSGTIVSGEEDGAGNNSSYNGVTFTGSYSTPDAAGRGTITLTPSGTNFPLAPSHYVYYVVSATEMYMMSTDAHANFTLLSGDVLAQTQAFTSASTLSGPLLLYGTGGNNGNGYNFFPQASGAEVIYLTVSGQNVTATEDHNHGGSLRLGSAQGTLPYAIDTAGRVTLAGGNNGTPVFYMADSGHGFGTQQNDAVNNQGDAELQVIEQQSGGPFSCTSGNGTSDFGVLHPAVPLSVFSGSLLQNGTSTFVATFDLSSPQGVLTKGGTLTFTCAPDQNGVTTATTGRTILTDQNGKATLMYQISPTKSLTISMDPSNTQPDINIIQK